MNMKKMLALVLSSALTLSLAACGAVVNPPGGNTGSGSAANGKDNAATAGEIKIVMGHAGNDNLADGIMSLKFNELIAERSNGRIVVEYHTNDTLGDEDELLQQVINGSIQASCCSTSTFSNYTDELDALQLPFLYDSYEDEKAALVSDEARALYADMEKLGVKITDCVEIGFRNFANNVRPITCMDDLKGIKMRVVPSTLLTDVASAIGMTSTPVSYSEIYSSLQSGVIEGEEINLVSIATQSHYEVLKYVSIINFYAFTSAMTFNLNWFNSLSAEDQALIQECSAEARDYAKEQTQRIDEESLQTCLDQKMEVNYIEGAQRQEFIDAVQPVYEKYMAESDHIKAYVEMAQALQG